MFNVKKVWAVATVIVFSLNLTGCFHLRTPEDFPPQLKNLYLSTNNVNSSITTQLARELRAANVNLAPPAKLAPLTLELSNSHTNVVMPISFNNSTATSYLYQISIQLKLYTHDQKFILNEPITISQSVIHNVNQIDTPVITPLMRRTLTKRLINNIYDRITSVDVIKAIDKLNSKQKK